MTDVGEKSELKLDELEPASLSRLMLSIDATPCRFACTYCFAGFSQYARPMTLEELEAQPSRADDFDILYPACDTDLFARSDYESILDRVVRFGKSISISTKAVMNRRALRALTPIAEELSRKSAAVKVGVSLSTKYGVPQIEPRTPPYQMRLRSLMALKDAGIPNALILRPLLADISDDEYREILIDTAGLTTRVLLGDEWLDEGDGYRAMGRTVELPVVQARRVNWAPGIPVWHQRSILGREERLVDMGVELGFRMFRSDLDLMRDVL